MKKTILSLLIGSVIFFSCRKEHLAIVEEACLLQTDSPDSRSYTCDSVVAVSYSGKHCGLLPLSQKNYWIYQDSVFNNGSFSRVQFDTLRFSKTYRSLPDNLVWWESNIEVGLPNLLYSNDSSIFLLEQRLFSPDCIQDAKKEYSLFPGESTNYLAHFDDAAAMGKSVKMEETMATPAGSFLNCILFEKNARSYRKDDIYFKPGIGVVKYTREEAPMGSPITKLQQISTLIKFHIE